jgi:uncharacterized protein (TIGR03086 family)
VTDIARSPIPLLGPALDAFGAKVQAVSPGAWARPTPCTEWDVRDVVNHVVAEHLWVPHLLRGETLADVGDRYDGDVIGDDPVEAWERASEQSRAAWHTASDDFVVHLSFGDTPASEYGEQMLSDLVIHGWDLARGAGLDDQLDPVAAARVLDYLGPRAKEWHEFGVFAEPIEVDSDDATTRLLGLTGRRA